MREHQDFVHIDPVINPHKCQIFYVRFEKTQVLESRVETLIKNNEGFSKKTYYPTIFTIDGCRESIAFDENCTVCGVHIREIIIGYLNLGDEISTLKVKVMKYKNPWYSLKMWAKRRLFRARNQK